MEVIAIDEYHLHVNSVGAMAWSSSPSLGMTRGSANAVYHTTGGRAGELPLTTNKLLWTRCAFSSHARRTASAGQLRRPGSRRATRSSSAPRSSSRLAAVRDLSDRGAVAGCGRSL
jgi:hypothetical protein